MNLFGQISLCGKLLSRKERSSLAENTYFIEASILIKSNLNVMTSGIKKDSLETIVVNFWGNAAKQVKECAPKNSLICCEASIEMLDEVITVKGGKKKIVSIPKFHSSKLRMINKLHGRNE